MRRYVLGVCTVLLITACSGSNQQPTTTLAASATRAAQSTTETASPRGESAEVVAVFDGDSLLVSTRDGEVEVRLLGINAPEGSECHGDVALHDLEELLDSGEPTLVTDSDETDQYGRVLGYLYVDGLNVNLALIANGDAVAVQGDHTDNEEFALMSDAAFANGLGMWAPDACGSTQITNSVAIVDYVYNPAGRDDEALNDEWVAIGNAGTQEIDMGDWILRDESTQNRFRFPEGFLLAPASEVLVRSGCGQDDTAELFWCADGPVWSNGGDTVILQLPDGTVVARDRYPGDS